jgi:hypothetical protein
MRIPDEDDAVPGPLSPPVPLLPPEGEKGPTTVLTTIRVGEGFGTREGPGFGTGVGEVEGLGAHTPHVRSQAWALGHQGQNKVSHHSCAKPGVLQYCAESTHGSAVASEDGVMVGNTEGIMVGDRDG